MEFQGKNYLDKGEFKKMDKGTIKFISKKLTKREMVEEIINGLCFTREYKRKIINYCISNNNDVKSVYNEFLKSKMTKKDKLFYIHKLVTL